MAPVFAKLSHLGIEPRRTTSRHEAGSSVAAVEQIRPRAEALRREWMPEESRIANLVDEPDRGPQGGVQSTTPRTPTLPTSKRCSTI